MRFLGRPRARASVLLLPTRVSTALCVAGLLLTHPDTLAAQAPVPGAGSPNPAASVDASRGAALAARYHVRQMENVLERAVQHAADMMRRRLAAFTPDVLALAGAPRAQGYRIDGYGLFFSVEVPRLSESVNWALRVLSQDRDERVLASLHKVAADEQDPVVRADLERAIRTVQLQLAGLPKTATPPPSQRQAAVATPPAPSSPAAAPTPGGADRAESASAPVDAASTVETASLPPMSTAPLAAPTPEAPATEPPRDPSAAYEDEVKLALVDAMLDYAGSLPLPTVEWVTVAARDAGYVAFPDAVSDMVTVTLSVKVSDLVDFRAQRLTREEARTRVLVREF